MALPTKGGKVLLDFNLREIDAQMEGDVEVAPAHWRMTDPNHVVTCWGHHGNGSFESMVAIMRLAAIGARKATREELIENGIMVPRPIERPKIWTPGDLEQEKQASGD